MKGIARASKLSRIQVEEVKRLSGLNFEVEFVESRGDRDLKSTLIDRAADDFFTRELDEAVLEGRVDFGIHSAKDLPQPLPKGLEIAALTEGVDPRDSLVLREGFKLESLPTGAKICASSRGRHEAIRALRSDLVPADVRGTIDQRLTYIERDGIYGVMIAKAALIRLGYQLNTIDLDHPTAKGQGRLAIVCRSKDEAVIEQFSKIDARLISRA